MDQTGLGQQTTPIPNGIDPGRLPGSGADMDQVIKKKKWPPRKIATVAAIVLFVGAVGYGFWSMDGGSKLRVEAEKLTVSTRPGSAAFVSVRPSPSRRHRGPFPPAGRPWRPAGAHRGR